MGAFIVPVLACTGYLNQLKQARQGWTEALILETCRVSGSGCRVWGLWLMGSGFRVQGSGFRV